jgi:hypothetical protein
VETAIKEMWLVELGERSSPMETPPVKKNGWLGGERERESFEFCFTFDKFVRPFGFVSFFVCFLFKK